MCNLSLAVADRAVKEYKAKSELELKNAIREVKAESEVVLKKAVKEAEVRSEAKAKANTLINAYKSNLSMDIMKTVTGLEETEILDILRANGYEV